MPHLLGIGDNTVDIYVDRGVQFPGGNAVNVAVLARRLGAETGYLGCLGNDAYGDLLRESLASEGVDLAHLRRIDGPNAWCRIKHDGNDRVFERSIPGVRGRYDLTAADGAYITSFDLAHTSVSSDLDEHLPFLARHAPLLSYDYSEYWRRPGKERTFAHVDIAFLSSPGGSDDECRALIRRATDGGVSTLVVVTRGVRGSCAGLGDSFVSEGIRPATVVDTLGAGDAFIAAFLVDYLGHRDPARALARGAENAALACAYEGAFGHGVPMILPTETPSQVLPARR